MLEWRAGHEVLESMKSILLIAPNKALQETAEAVAKENGLDIDVVLGNLSNGVEIAKEAEAKGAEVIITRGGTYQVIKEALAIPVVEIQVNAFDILRAFKGLLNYNGSIGIIGYENVIFGIETLTEVLGLDLHKVVFKDEDEAPRQVFEIAKKGVKEFVGDTIGIKTVVEMGLNGHLILSGKEAIAYAVDEAFRVLKIRREEKARAERFKIIMDFVHDGIIAVDDKGNTTIYNKMAEQIFGKTGLLIGKHIEEIIENTKLPEVIKTGRPQLGELQQVGNVVIATNRIPITVNNKVIGAVATFQDVTQIQKIEQKIRRELYYKGLVAKYNFEDIVYGSDTMAEIIEQAKKYSEMGTTTVLILGETGTGKELFAQSIHNRSLRANGPFVAINCAALPENLLESELFGYVEGSFTGARKGGKVGLFELAHKGTIFLDEIGDMPLNLQTRLLRVIQEKEVMRIGDDRVIPVDVRIIASTNKDLHVSVEMGEFRRDLYYRLNILTLKVPPLRKRKGDIANLVKHFINDYAYEFKKNIRGLTKEAENYLHSLDYPGNVRELEGMIERGVALSSGEYISVKDLGLTNGAVEKSVQERSPNNKMNLKELETETIKKALELTGNSVSKASEILGIDRTTLWRKMKNL